MRHDRGCTSILSLTGSDQTTPVLSTRLREARPNPAAHARQVGIGHLDITQRIQH